MRAGACGVPLKLDDRAAWLMLMLIVLATAAVYAPVLFNFFSGDDFVHLTWLTEAVKNPELVWRNFHTSWLEGTTTRFYRPLISVFMVSDYLIWKTNGLGFHLTNLACHLTSVLFLFLIFKEICRRFEIGTAHWPLAGAALFGLYPLHPEAVSWITGRVDSVVTVFVLGSFWCFMRWRATRRIYWSFISALAMALGLLSKEMAVTLPPLFFIWEFIAGRRTGGGIKSGFVGATAASLPFWLLLGLYFIVRRMALGTFVGGYDDSLFFVANLQLFIAGWIHGLRMMLVPINKELLGAHHPLTKLWEISLICLIAGSCLSTLTCGKLRAPAAFLLLWLALSLLPVYKIFGIADDLEGSRLAYLATAPLCGLITFALAGWLSESSGRWRGLFAGCATSVLILCAGALLWTNNQAWVLAGRESNLIRRQLDNLYHSFTGNPPVLLVGLPDNLHGAYICRNALVGMTSYPQMSRTASDCSMLGAFEPTQPFGFYKESLAKVSGNVKIFRWDGREKSFIPVAIPAAETPGVVTRWTTHELKNVLAPQQTGNVDFRWLEDGNLEATGGIGLSGRPQIHLKLNQRSCWSTDFLAIGITAGAAPGPGGQSVTPVGADLLYANDLHPDTDLRLRFHAPVPEGDGTLLFPLRSSPEWALGGNCRDLELLLPDRGRVVIKSVELIDYTTVAPQIRFVDSGFLGTRGFLHLSNGAREKAVELDARRVPGAHGIELEITRPNLTFESQNSGEPSRVVMRRVKNDTTVGTLILKRSDFPSTGLYEARPRAVDVHGSPVGVAGDHIVISIDS